MNPTLHLLTAACNDTTGQPLKPNSTKPRRHEEVGGGPPPAVALPSPPPLDKARPKSRAPIRVHHLRLLVRVPQVRPVLPPGARHPTVHSNVRFRVVQTPVIARSKLSSVASSFPPHSPSPVALGKRWGRWVSALRLACGTRTLPRRLSWAVVAGLCLGVCLLLRSCLRLMRNQADYAAVAFRMSYDIGYRLNVIRQR